MKEQGTTTLMRLREGKLNEEIAEAIETAIERMKATGKPAEVHLKLKFSPAGVEKGTKGDEIERTWIEDDIKLKLPALPKSNTLLFVDPDGGVTDKNPQQEIPGVRSA
jgi:hypothetical protein